MRCRIVSHGGTVLGELMLAQGVTLHQAGRELISGRPMQLLAVEEPAPVEAPAGASMPPEPAVRRAPKA